MSTDIQHISAPISILLVEDDELDAALTKKFIKKAAINCDITHIKDGREAVNFLLKRGNYKNISLPDLILLDMRLPGLSGPEIIYVLNAHEELRKIPVIIISSEIKQKTRLFQAGDSPYPCFVKWLGMKDFQSIAKAVEDIALSKKLNSMIATS